MGYSVEARVRRVVSDHLGVESDELAVDVSLTDTLAADSLDLLEVALALEDEFEIVLSESVIDSVRTYGDLVAAVDVGLGRHEPPRPATSEFAERVWARVISPASQSAGDLQRAGWLTPYTTQTIAEDALHAGRGARLEITVSPELPDARVARLQQDFAWLGTRGIQVQIRRDHHLGASGLRAHPHAAA
jgi:acyl carrier protein